MPTDDPGNPDDPEFKLANSRGGRGDRGGGVGGGAPGPGGGFGGSFGGSAFGVGPLPADFGPGQRKRKIVMGPNGPISVAYSPMVADTVPAMLSPGEGVLNNGAMAEPGMADFLQRANQMGMQRMAAGGMVPGGDMSQEGEMGDMSGGSGAGGDIRELLLALLPVLLGMDEPQGFGCGGEVKPQHFAWGGQVQRQQGGWRQPGGSAGMAPRAPQMPQAGLGGVGVGGKPGAQPAGFWGMVGNSGMFGNPYSAPGLLGAGGKPQAAPQPPGTNPWGEAPLAPGSPNPGDEWKNRIEALLKQYGQGGFFDPNGSPQLLDALRGEATQNADALRHRASSLADMQGLDAGQRGSYAMQTDLNTQGSVANLLNNAKLGMLQNQQQFGQGLLGKAYDANTQAWLAQLAKWMQGG